MCTLWSVHRAGPLWGASCPTDTLLWSRYKAVVLYNSVARYPFFFGSSARFVFNKKNKNIFKTWAAFSPSRNILTTSSICFVSAIFLFSCRSSKKNIQIRKKKSGSISKLKYHQSWIFHSESRLLVKTNAFDSKIAFFFLTIQNAALKKVVKHRKEYMFQNCFSNLVDLHKINSWYLFVIFHTQYLYVYLA